MMVMEVRCYDGDWMVIKVRCYDGNGGAVL